MRTPEQKAAAKAAFERFKAKLGPEAYAQYQRDAMQKLKDKDPELYKQRCLAAQRKRDLANPEKYRAIRKETVRRLKAKDPAYFVKASRKTNYGLTNETYNALVKEQEGRCAICMDEAKLCIDHDHFTNKVRQLLCSRCNHVLGHSKESIERLQAAIDYLKKWCKR